MINSSQIQIFSHESFKEIYHSTELTQLQPTRDGNNSKRVKGFSFQLSLLLSIVYCYYRYRLISTLCFGLTCLNILKRSDLDLAPCMLSATTVLARDFELPGFPTTNNGILSSMHTTIINTFSLRASLRAMLGPSSNSPIKVSWHLHKET